MKPVTQPRSAGPRVIVVGNEKGGSGKSTTAIHLTVALLMQGQRVGCLDLDARQATLTRHLENRRVYANKLGIDLKLPTFQAVRSSRAFDQAERELEEREAFEEARLALGEIDTLLIDTPGSDSHLSRLGHSLADILITPINDSFVDLDLIGKVDAETGRIDSPSIYSEMVWEQRQKRAFSGQPAIDWVVMRNRLSHIDSRSKRQIHDLLRAMAKRFAFRLAPGFGERVIFRDLFPKGLTLFDLRVPGVGVEMTMSHVAARQEVRALLQAIGLIQDDSELDAESAPPPQSAEVVKLADNSQEPRPSDSDALMTGRG